MSREAWEITSPSHTSQTLVVFSSPAVELIGLRV